MIIDCNPLKMDYNPIILYANQIHYSQFQSILNDFLRDYS